MNRQEFKEYIRNPSVLETVSEFREGDIIAHSGCSFELIKKVDSRWRYRNAGCPEEEGSVSSFDPKVYKRVLLNVKPKMNIDELRKHILLPGAIDDITKNFKAGDIVYSKPYFYKLVRRDGTLWKYIDLQIPASEYTSGFPPSIYSKINFDLDDLKSKEIKKEFPEDFKEFLDQVDMELIKSQQQENFCTGDIVVNCASKAFVYLLLEKVEGEKFFNFKPLGKVEQERGYFSQGYHKVNDLYDAWAESKKQMTELNEVNKKAEKILVRWIAENRHRTGAKEAIIICRVDNQKNWGASIANAEFWNCNAWNRASSEEANFFSFLLPASTTRMFHCFVEGWTECPIIPVDSANLRNIGSKEILETLVKEFLEKKDFVKKFPEGFAAWFAKAEKNAFFYKREKWKPEEGKIGDVLYNNASPSTPYVILSETKNQDKLYRTLIRETSGYFSSNFFRINDLWEAFVDESAAAVVEKLVSNLQKEEIEMTEKVAAVVMSRMDIAKGSIKEGLGDIAEGAKTRTVHKTGEVMVDSVASIIPIEGVREALKNPTVRTMTQASLAFLIKGMCNEGLIPAKLAPFVAKSAARQLKAAGYELSGPVLDQVMPMGMLLMEQLAEAGRSLMSPEEIAIIEGVKARVESPIEEEFEEVIIEKNVAKKTKKETETF